MKHTKTSFFQKTIFVAFLALTYLSPIHGLLKVQVNKGVFSPIPISITTFTGEPSQLSKNMRQIIIQDLSTSGLFKVLPESAYIQNNASLKQAVRYADWRLIKSDGLLHGEITESGEEIVVRIKLLDVFAEKELINVQLRSRKSDWRKLSHMISNAVYERLTGEKGYFTTKVAYVSEAGQADKRIKRLAMMDYDGNNHRFLTSGRTFVMTPRLSPDGRKIAYFTIVNYHGNVYLYDVDDHTTELLGRFKGMSYAPRFSKDGKRILFSLADGMVSHVYEMDLKTREKRQLTQKAALNTSAYYSPDGTQIAFVSDRDGTPQIYTMSISGENDITPAKRITFGEGRYYTPVYSPNGKHLAFTKTHQGTFYVGVLKPDGTGERTLSQGYFVEAPTWSPNSQTVMYTRRTPINPATKSQISRIYMMHISGFNEREVVTPLDATDPEWSASL